MNESRIIKKYERYVQRFMDKLHLVYEDYLDKNRRKYAFILNRLNTFYFITNFISSKKIEVKGDDRILFTIYNKAALDLYSIYYCLMGGLEVEASIIFRSLYELYLNTELIFKEDSAKRISLYKNFVHIERWNHILERKKLIKDGFSQGIDLSVDEMNNYELMYKKYKDDYHPKYAYSWAYSFMKSYTKNRNPNLIDICEYLGKSYVEEYVIVYGTHSKLAHSSSILEDFYRDNNSKNHTIVNSPKFDDSLVSLSVLTISYCEQIIVNIIEYLKIQDYKELKIYLNSFSAYTAKLGSEYLNKNKS